METEHSYSMRRVRRSKRWIVGGLVGFILGAWLLS